MTYIRMITDGKCTNEWLQAHGFADDARHIVLDAVQRVIARGYLGVVSPLIVLWSILRWERKLGRVALEALAGDLHPLETAVDDALTCAASRTKELTMDITRVDRLAEDSIAEAPLMGKNWVCSEQVLLALCQSDDPDLVRELRRFNVTYDGVKKWIVDLYAREGI